MEKKLKNLKASQKGGVDEGLLEGISNELEALRREFDNFKEHTTHDLRALTNDIVPFKADKSELEELFNNW